VLVTTYTTAVIYYSLQLFVGSWFLPLIFFLLQKKEVFKSTTTATARHVCANDIIDVQAYFWASPPESSSPSSESDDDDDDKKLL